MAFNPITVEFDPNEDCVGSCCDEVCPQHLVDLYTSAAVLDLSVTCALCPPSPDCNFCFPITTTMNQGGNNYDWDSVSGCNNPLNFRCANGNYTLTWPTAVTTPITIPTTVVSVVANPFAIVFTSSSFWFSDCDTGSGQTEYEVTITITE